MFPKQIKVAGHLIRVILKDRISKHENIVGKANYAEGTIVLSKIDKSGSKICKQSMQENMFHEVIHHICAKYDARISESNVRRI